ncbi:MAG TPA: alkaline phosphatase family protein [Acidimicrobiia bacterium]
MTASSAAAFVALESCSGSGSRRLSAPRPASSTTTTVPRRAGRRPDLTRAAGADLIPQIEHIVVVMQENHSYDSYFGMLGRGDGFHLDAHGMPTASNSDAHGNAVRAFHMANTCQSHALSQNWNSSHIQWNNGKLDGFVRSPSGAAAMGYWDGADIPFYYALARTFPLCDRWFASCLGQTSPNRRFLLCGSALGSINTNITEGDIPAPRNGTIVEALERHDISWRDYNTTFPSLLLFPPVFSKYQDKCPKIGQFFTDAAAGKLPSFCLVEPNNETQTEEDPQDISMGEAFTASVINAVMKSPNWPKTLLVLCYDEHGGYYDHVPPPSATAPDDIKPILKFHPGDHLDGLSSELPGNYARYGFRVPAVVVSPFAKPNYVSHVVHDHTSILSLVEHKWNLPALTDRDGAADNLLDSIDLGSAPAFLAPPTLPKPKNTTGAPICLPGRPGPIPNP